MKPLDKLRGILGRDCNGKALRKGDRAEVLRIGDSVPRHLRRDVVTVIGPGIDKGRVLVDVPYPGDGSDWFQTRGANLRKIDDKEEANWASITESTSWTPQTIEDEVVA